MSENQRTASELIPNLKSSIRNLANVRILLWDIDGTLLRSTTQGNYREYFGATMHEVFGSAGNLDAINASGMTDTQIICVALEEENFTPERVFAEKENLLKVFKVKMSDALAGKSEPFEILPGAKEILRETAADPRFINALLTGNLSVAAQIKLESIELWHYFENAPNAFGEVSHERKNLATEAGKLFNERYDYKFEPSQFIVIGDTPNDIQAARHFGAKVVCVETGRGVERKDLESHNPDALIKDLNDTEKVLELLGSV